MSCLSLMEAKLPPGFRFHPRDEELVCDYLGKKVAGTPTQNSYEFPLMTEVDLNKVEPWDLPEVACIGGKEWYFFSLLDRKYATGLRMNRATLSGYWKATGKDRRVNRKGKLVGMRKTLVFYTGRAPKGKKTEWVMHEFRLQSPSHPQKITFKEEWVLGRVFYKNVGGTCSQHISQESSSFDEGTLDEGPFDEVPGSPPPPLPPNLPDPSLFFDNQTPLNVEVFEQVPCFSNFTQTYPTPTLLPDLPLLEPSYLPPTAAFLLSNHLGPAPDLMASLLDPLIFCDDEDIIKALLDHQTHQKMMEMMLPNSAAEGGGGGGGGGGSPGSHFSEMELWNDNYWF